MTESVAEPHAWVSVYETCERCNYADHRCHFCGEDLDHESYDPKGRRHWLSDCRPDLVEHEPGPLCTWPLTGDPKLDAELDRPGCYAYQDGYNGQWGSEHKHFHTDCPMV